MHSEIVSLKSTTTRCPLCLDPVPGRVVALEGKGIPECECGHE